MTSEEPALKQIIQAYETTNQSVIGVQKVDVEEVSKYGIIQPKNKSGSLMK